MREVLRNSTVHRAQSRQLRTREVSVHLVFWWGHWMDLASSLLHYSGNFDPETALDTGPFYGLVWPHTEC